MCDCISAAQNVELCKLLPSWRQSDFTVDHRCLPYAAILTECVVMVWPALQVKEPFVYFPEACTMDTRVIHLEWFNDSGEGVLDAYCPLHP